MRILILFFLLIGCSSPSPRYFGNPPSRQIVDGWTIDVYRDGNYVQAIRLNPTMLPRTVKYAPRALKAITAATGCQVRANSATGDSVVINARLNCP